MPECTTERTASAVSLPALKSAHPASSALVPRGVVALVLAALCVLIAITRLHTYAEAPEIDQTIYALIAHEMKAGRALYADLWDHKPPAIFLTYAAGETVCGYGPRSLYFLGLTASLLTMMGVYAAGSALPWGREAGLWAAALWAVASGDLYLEANQPNTEDFINPCLIGAFALWVRGSDRPWGWWRTVAIGSLFAWASLYKHVVVVVPFLLACVHVARPPGGSEHRRRALAQVGVIVALGAAAWGLVCSYFALRGEFRPFYDAVFRFNRAYAGNPVRNILALTAPIHWASARQVLGRVLVYLALAVFALGWKRGPARPWLLWGALALGIHAAVASPGRLFPHYFQLWLPAGAVGLAWLAGPSLGPGLAVGARFQRYACPLAVALIVLARLPEFALSAERWTEIKYARYHPHWAEASVEGRDIGRRMAEVLRPGETFYVWGHLALPYYESRRPPPSGVLYDGPILDGPLKDTLTERLQRDLAAARPELIVDVTPLWPDEARDRHPVRRDWEARYRPYRGDDRYRAIRLYVRSGGALEARLARPENHADLLCRKPNHKATKLTKTATKK